MDKRKWHILLSLLLTAIFIMLGFTVFIKAYARLWETIISLGDSLAYLWGEITGNRFNEIPIKPSNILTWFDWLPKSFDKIGDKITIYLRLLINGNNFVLWGSNIGEKIGGTARLLVYILPFVLIFIFVVKKVYIRPNNRYNRDTKPLKAFKFISKHVYTPIKNYVLDYIEFVRSSKWLKILWWVIWLLNLNAISIIVAFISYYLYFVVSFNVSTIYGQVCNLVLDVTLTTKNIPWWIFVICLWILFCKWREKKANKKLKHFEARNCGFINELPIVSMTCGSMGKKKTTIIVDMSLSQAVMFRQKALEIIQSNDMKFPYFPWISFEKQLQKCIEYGTVFNLATVKGFVKKKRERFKNNGNFNTQLYGYDGIKYGMEYNDRLKIQDLFDVLESYALAYFIYIVQTSIITANLSIRTDDEIVDKGNFPLWINDFFPKGVAKNSRYANILDFDILRLGKKLLDGNPYACSFEFGVVVITEVGKERGNNLELKEVKKGTEETNQKNDLFNVWLKMCRHSATVDNFPFIKVFTDEQHPASWGADARDLCDVINVCESGEQRIALPLYIFEETISDLVFSKFISLYYELRFLRGDNTLLMHLLKMVTAYLYRRNVRLYNQYGYSVAKIEKESGTLDGKRAKKKYFLMNKKIYSRRFSTDCFSDYFNELAKKSKVGLMDYVEYMTEKASVEELKKQNSYFINSLYKDASSNQSASG